MIEAVLDPPRQILFAQQHEARGEAIAEMKADGLEYDERMALLEEVTWPQAARRAAGADLRDLPADATRGCRETRWTRSRWCARCTSRGWASPTSSAATSSRAPRACCCATSPTPTARCARPCPTRTAPPELEDLIEWLGETVRQTDSSLLDEWEALTDPDARAAHPHRAAAAAAAAPAVAAGAGVPGDDPQRDVAPGGAGRSRRPRRADGAGGGRRRRASTRRARS